MKKYSFNLRKIRISKNLSQQEVADLINSNQRVISRYETNQELPTIERLVDIALALNVTLKELIEIQNMHNTKEKD